MSDTHKPHPSSETLAILRSKSVPVEEPEVSSGEVSTTSPMGRAEVRREVEQLGKQLVLLTMVVDTIQKTTDVSGYTKLREEVTRMSKRLEAWQLDRRRLTDDIEAASKLASDALDVARRVEGEVKTVLDDLAKTAPAMAKWAAMVEGKLGNLDQELSALKKHLQDQARLQEEASRRIEEKTDEQTKMLEALDRKEIERDAERKVRTKLLAEQRVVEDKRWKTFKRWWPVVTFILTGIAGMIAWTMKLLYQGHH